MLIRSQNKEVLIVFESLLDVEVSGGVISARRDMGWCCLLGEYSTKAKAMKVLDMIQEAYMDFEASKITSTGLATAAYTGRLRYILGGLRYIQRRFRISETILRFKG